MTMSVDETIGALELMLRSGSDIDPEDAPKMQALLDEPPIQDVVALVERQNPVRAAVVLRLLSREKSIAVFDALDAAHQADIIDELGNSDVYEFFDALEPEDRVSLLERSMSSSAPMVSSTDMVISCHLSPGYLSALDNR